MSRGPIRASGPWSRNKHSCESGEHFESIHVTLVDQCPITTVVREGASLWDDSPEELDAVDDIAIGDACFIVFSDGRSGHCHREGMYDDWFPEE